LNRTTDGGAAFVRGLVDPQDAYGRAEALTGDIMSDVINNRAHHRYELEVEGHLATEHYKLDGNVITFEHTDVPKELGGKGVGSKLVQGALDQVRTAGLKLIPECPFVKAWIEKHPEYADLVKK
jgi:predicted GNAT family acetyltransferase